ncbi:helix-turn-helix domain-containing protein [Rothia similmucilaginosa]
MRSVPSNEAKRGNRRGTGPASRFSQLLNEELRAAQSRRRLTLRALEELTGVSRNRLSLTLNLDSSPLNTNEFELICRALELNPGEVCFRAEAALQKELAAKSGYHLAAHPADHVLTDDSSWGA